MYEMIVKIITGIIQEECFEMEMSKSIMSAGLWVNRGNMIAKSDGTLE